MAELSKGAIVESEINIVKEPTIIIMKSKVLIARGQAEQQILTYMYMYIVAIRDNFGGLVQ